jgi:hypothetical protein
MISGEILFDEARIRVKVKHLQHRKFNRSRHRYRLHRVTDIASGLGRRIESERRVSSGEVCGSHLREQFFHDLIAAGHPLALDFRVVKVAGGPSGGAGSKGRDSVGLGGIE